ncbi:hypothetical protein [Methylobacterium sp. CM6257]|jgi:hypothetical protein
MHRLHAERTPEDRLESIPIASDPLPGSVPSVVRAEPARVIEIGEVTAGIAVPEGRGVRFFSSARDFDGLDGAVFRTAEQAARAARERVRARARSAASRPQPRRRRA